jgi:hypothetical protein
MLAIPQMIFTVASLLARGGRGGSARDHLRLVTDIAEGVTCAASACHITSGGYNCAAGGNEFGDPSFRLQNALTPHLPRGDLTRKEKMEFYHTIDARTLIDHDGGLKVSRGPAPAYDPGVTHAFCSWKGSLICGSLWDRCRSCSTSTSMASST